MELGKIRWIEKFQTQLVTAAGLAAVYLAVWPLVSPDDPHSPAVFLALDGFGRLALFAVLAWVFAGLCALLTCTARPESSLLVAVVGIGGLSLRSSQIRSLFWLQTGSLRDVFLMLLLEVLVLAVVLVGVLIVVSAVRAFVGRVRPGWLWRARISPPDQAGKEPDTAPKGLTSMMGVVGIFIRRAHSPSRSGRWLLSLVVNLAIAVGLLFLIMRSANRGQILFALFASFFLSTFIAEQIYPTRFAVVSIMLPLLVGAVFYCYGVVTSISDAPNVWMTVPYSLRALPLDWLTAGVGGAMVADWVSSRVREAKLIEKAQAQENSASAKA